MNCSKLAGRSRWPRERRKSSVCALRVSCAREDDGTFSVSRANCISASESSSRPTNALEASESYASSAASSRAAASSAIKSTDGRDGGIGSLSWHSPCSDAACPAAKRAPRRRYPNRREVWSSKGPFSFVKAPATRRLGVTRLRSVSANFEPNFGVGSSGFIGARQSVDAALDAAAIVVAGLLSTPPPSSWLASDERHDSLRRFTVSRKDPKSTGNGLHRPTSLGTGQP